jgi:hypothetical protein
MRFATLTWVALLALTGCAKKTNPESAGLTCDDSTDICPVLLTLSPGPTTYTNSTITIKAAVVPADHAPERIQLLKNGQAWMTVTAPFSYDWNTTGDPEGTFQIVATASIGGNVATSNSITIVVDRTAPTVQFQPKTGATNVALSDPILVTFSEAIDPSTISSTSVTLTTALGADLGATSTLSADLTTLTVSIGNPSLLTFPATITGVLGGTVRDPAGNAVASPPAWSWTAPLWVKLPSFLGSMPSLSQDATGKPLITYLQPPANQSSNPTMGIARYTVGSTWDATIVPPTTNQITSTVSAVDPSGLPVVAWSDPADNHVRVARMAGSSWSMIGANADSPLPSGSNRVTSIALDSTGAPTLAIPVSTEQMGLPEPYIVRWVSPSWQVLTTTFPAWSTAIVTIDSTGAPAVLSSTTLERYVGGSWLTIPIPSQDNPFASLALDSLDRTVLAIETGSVGSWSLNVSTLIANTWTPFQPAVTTSTQVGSEAHIAMAPGDDPVIVWSSVNGSAQDLLVARYTTGTTSPSWNTQFGAVNALSGGVAANGQIVVDGQGRPCVAWDEYNSSTSSTSVYVWKSNL